jgi:hypothetical protein
MCFKIHHRDTQTQGWGKGVHIQTTVGMKTFRYSRWDGSYQQESTNVLKVIRKLYQSVVSVKNATNFDGSKTNKFVYLFPPNINIIKVFPIERLRFSNSAMNFLRTEKSLLSRTIIWEMRNRIPSPQAKYMNPTHLPKYTLQNAWNVKYNFLFLNKTVQL